MLESLFIYSGLSKVKVTSTREVSGFQYEDSTLIYSEWSDEITVKDMKFKDSQLINESNRFEYTFASKRYR